MRRRRREGEGEGKKRERKRRKGKGEKERKVLKQFLTGVSHSSFSKQFLTKYS